MKYYSNLSGKSGVRAFEYTQDGILVEFKNGGIYEYTNSSAGKDKISIMKILAKKGYELNRFINLEVKHLYSRRLK